MKKIFFTLCIFLLASCQTLDMRDVYEVKETSDKKLPTLEVIYIADTLDNPQYWEPGQKVVQQSGTFATLLYREVEENLTIPTGDFKGYLELKNSTVLTPNVLWAVPSGLSLMTINLIGFPFSSYTAKSVINVRLLDRKGRLIKRYSAYTEDTKYIALWWGYAETIENGEKFKLKVYKQSLVDIIRQIQQDYKLISERLK